MFSFLFMSMFACNDTAKNEKTQTNTSVSKTATKVTPKVVNTTQKPVDIKKEIKIQPKDNKASTSTLDPKLAIKKAPDTFEVLIETTKGNIVVDVTRAWSPQGADRFYNLVDMGFFSDIAFFRAARSPKGGMFVYQFGLHGDPSVTLNWRSASIPDDPVVQTNDRGYLTFAKSSAPNSRTTQIFINCNKNDFLDQMGFSPFGKISEKKGGGMAVVDALNNEYGERPNQGRIQMQGNEYLKSNFPNLDYIKSARICQDDC